MKNINELNTKYETEKKQQAIALLTKEKEADQIRLEKERNVKFFPFAIAFMLFIVAGVLFYRLSEKKFTDHELNIEQEMTLWMNSDGVVDQFGRPDGKKFMSGRLQKSIFAKQRVVSI